MNRSIKLSFLAYSLIIAVGAPLAPAMAVEAAPEVKTGIGAPAYAGLNRPGAVLPSSSNGEGEPEPLNSLPRGFEDGTAAMQRHQALEAFRAGKPQAASPQ